MRVDEQEFEVERLEARQLLAVQVTQIGHTLRLSGNHDSDEVVVFGDGTDGEVGVNVNFENVGTFSGIERIIIRLRGGSDVLTLHGIEVTGDVTINTGAGNDGISIRGAAVARAEIGGNLRVQMGGNQGDNIEIAGSGTGVVVGHGVILGADEVEMQGTADNHALNFTDVSFVGNLLVRLSRHVGAGDEVTMHDVNVFGTTRLFGSAQDDVFDIEHCQFVGETRIISRGGSDFVDMTGVGVASHFVGDVVFNGGAGYDLLWGHGTTIFDGSDALTGFELVA